MKKIIITIISMAIISSLLITGCSREAKITKLKDVEKYEFYSKGRLDNVLVVGKPRIEENREDFEDHFSKALRRRGTDAIPSYELILDMQDLNRENVKNAAIEAQTGAVLVTRVVGVDNTNVTMPGHTSVDMYTGPRGGTIMMGPYIQGPYVKNVTMVRVETALFETKTEKMIWHASSKILNPDSVNEAINDFSKAILSQLREDGYVR
jgi:hypothetical protein